MALNFSRRAKAITAGLVMLLLFFIFLLTRPPSAFQVKISAIQRSGNGVLLLKLLLTNATRHTYGIADDVDGGPALLLDNGITYHPTLGKTWVKPLANKHQIQLAPGAGLTCKVWLTNAPPRFRFTVDARDLTTQNAPSPLNRVLGRRLSLEFYKWRLRHLWKPPSSMWIDREDLPQ